MILAVMGCAGNVRRRACFGLVKPAPVIAVIMGFVLYRVLANGGLQPPVAEMPGAAQAAKA